ncbi:MAG: hypothetical protein KF876_13405 [Nitrospira sp.]|nr:hypothetical protein [Nitrospira sp.]MBX3335117.1 hypothetical protein [Nitrospira sp.]MDR4465247.1 hypothetical protein [Nitrospira sp.]MDR4467348.1 hypothetical protein [Nitrospira sp.]
MNKIQVVTRLIGFACLVGMAGCTSGKTAMVSGSDNSPVSTTTEPTSAIQTEAAAESLSDSLKGCLAGIPNDSSDGAKMVAEQSCQENEQLRQSVVGTAIAKSGGRASAGTQGDSLEACMTRIPEDATSGQRMLAEETCERDQSSHR